MLILSFLIIAAIIVLDQLTKQLVLARLAAEGVRVILPGVLRFSYVENTGAAFGMMREHRWVFLVFSSVAILGLLVYLIVTRRRTTLWEAVPLSFIIGGGIGNMIDRTVRGFVVDFVDVICFPFWKYVFNVADIFVVVGCCLMILTLILGEVRERAAAGGAASDGQSDADADADEKTGESGETSAGSDVNTDEGSGDAGRGGGEA